MTQTTPAYVKAGYLTQTDFALDNLLDGRPRPAPVFVQKTPQARACSYLDQWKSNPAMQARFGAEHAERMRESDPAFAAALTAEIKRRASDKEGAAA